MEGTIERIKKCLSLAGNNSSENEVNNAIKMAQRLALKAGISIEDIDMSEIRPIIEVVQYNVDQNTKTCPSWRYALCKTIADNFKTDVFINKVTGGSSLVIIGDKDDVDITREVFQYTENAYLNLSKKYINSVKKKRKLNRSLSIRFKNDYFVGFLEGITKAFAENIQEFGLMVIKPDEVNEWMDEHCKTGSRSSIKGAGSEDAYNNGLKDGDFVGSSKRGLYI